MKLIDFLATNIARTNGMVRRWIAQEALKINGVPATDINQTVNNGDIIKIGRKITLIVKE